MTFSISRFEFLRTALAPARATHIVDVGANPVEPVPYQGLLKNGGCHVTGFEPQAEAFQKLQKIKGENETYHQFAVGDGSRKTLYETQHDSMTSFYQGDQAGCKYLGRFGSALQVVRETPLDTVALDTADVPDFDLLKIDIQGGEVTVFNGAADMLTRAVAVIPEVRFYQLYHDEPMFAGVDADLRARGFALHKFLFAKARHLPTSQYNRLNPNIHNQLIDGDAVYIRDLAYPDRYTDEELKHLAILSDGVWFSFDLTIRCLDLLVARGAIAKTTPAQYLRHLPKNHLKPELAEA